jgi:hypothetical protein
MRQPHQRCILSLLALAVLAACGGSDPALPVVEGPDVPGGPVTLVVGQELHLTLGTVGGGHYDSLPAISSPALRFVDAAHVGPFTPGGPRQLFRFVAKRPGTAVITFTHTDDEPTVTSSVTVR